MKEADTRLKIIVCEKAYEQKSTVCSGTILRAWLLKKSQKGSGDARSIDPLWWVRQVKDPVMT